MVYHANYLKFIERARSEIFFRADRLPEGEEGLFVVRRLHADFIAPARLADTLQVQTVPEKMRAASVTLVQRVYRGETLLFKAAVELAFIRQGRPVRMSEALKGFLSAAFGAETAKEPPHHAPQKAPPPEGRG